MARFFRPHPIALAALALLCGLAAPAAAARFPEVTAEERALTAVPGHPNASAVVLVKKGRFTMIDPDSGELVPTFSVQVRRKILTEEGKKYGEVMVFHSQLVRLRKLEGRTVLPDGRVLPLGKDAMFRRRVSQAEREFVTSIAFPSVEVGAILDYQYELELTSPFLFEPWYFQEEVPTLHSEMVYEVPRELVVSSYLQDPLKLGIQQNTEKVRKGWKIATWGKNLPAVPLEPYGVPYVDTASRFMLLPLEFQGMGGTIQLFKDWGTTCAVIAADYEMALKWKGAAEKKAQELAASGNPMERAEALYRFVRDEVANEDVPGVYLMEKMVDDVLKAKRGDSAAKALLLKAMLQGIGVPARLVWAAERSGGLVNMEFATPWWFDSVLVVAEIGGGYVFLDPSDRRLAFGRLAPGFEGMPALIVDNPPKQVLLPAAPFDQNTSQARIQMELDAGGRLSGRGSLTLMGHPAWERLGEENAEKSAKAWKDWLAARYEGFEIADVQVAESVDAQKVEVTWTLAQRGEEVLGDEALLVPSLPLGPFEQPFQLPAANRLTPVLFEFADREDLVLALRWPEGWRPDALPSDTRTVNAAGVLQIQVTVNEAERSLVYQRRLDVKERFVALAQYGMIRSLFNHAEKSDAQALGLVRR